MYHRTGYKMTSKLNPQETDVVDIFSAWLKSPCLQTDMSKHIQRRVFTWICQSNQGQTCVMPTKRIRGPKPALPEGG